MAEAAFWLARMALVVAGAAFLCYVAVLVVLVLASSLVHPRQSTDHAPGTEQGDPS